MVLKVEQKPSASPAVLALSGRMESDEVQHLKAHMESVEQPIALDLEQVHLVDLDAVRFLAACEKRGIELRNCRPHVRAWISLEMPAVGDLE